jgi:Asp-tRNA(Asn)/Glu-tRNA(Gln) amidotransferase A subunit family amidase
LPLAAQESAGEDAARAAEIGALRAAVGLIGLDFTEDELALMRAEVTERRALYERLRKAPLDNAVSPALVFSPLLPGITLRRGSPSPSRAAAPDPYAPSEAEAPAALEDLAFATIGELAPLVRARKVSCRALTEMYLARLERVDEELHCVVSFTRERALAQADVLDEELAHGKWRGPLHGIPWGAKDLLAVRGTPTTWGAKPFEDQVIDVDATVVQRLDAAGAILIAKLSLGSLAMGDVWFRGKTRNPWNPERGSSGSSAGSASATAAGAVVFAIGSETLGSIVSPSVVCGTSSLRPTFGRVSRYGAMALSWSMDKLGPLCRSAEDCWLVMRAIQGPDGLDPSVQSVPWTDAPLESFDLAGLRVGIPRGAFDEERTGEKTLEEFEALGVTLVDVDLPEFTASDLLIVLSAEAATAFDELTRDGRDELLTEQGAESWPNTFRAARLIPAVEYLRAQRMRTQLMLAMERCMRDVDVLIHPPFAGDVLGITNLTGHPTFVAPCRFDDRSMPRSICLTGQLFDEERLLALAARWQASTDHHRRHPDPSGVRHVAK